MLKEEQREKNFVCNSEKKGEFMAFEIRGSKSGNQQGCHEVMQ